MKNLKHKLIIALIIAIAQRYAAYSQQDVVPAPVKFINLTGEATATVNGSSMNFTVNMIIAGEDSLSATLLTMGMPVGKIFASKNEYKIWNTLENSGYAGKNPEALSRLSGLQVSVRELIRLFRGQPPTNLADFTMREKQAGGALYQKLSDNGAIFALMGDRGEALQLQFKNSANELIGNITNEDFRQTSAGFFPKVVKISVPKRSLSISVTWTKVEGTQSLTKPMNFLPPQSAEIINTDELLNEE